MSQPPDSRNPRGDEVVMTAIPDHITIRMQAIPVPRMVVVLLLAYLVLSLPLVTGAVIYGHAAWQQTEAVRVELELTRQYTESLIRLMIRAEMDPPAPPWEGGTNAAGSEDQEEAGLQ